MKRKYVIWLVVVLFTCLFTLSLPAASQSALMAEPLPTPSSQDEITNQIEIAILEAIALSENYKQAKIATNLQVTDIATSLDQQWGTAWVVYYDVQIEALIPSEPALAVTHLVKDDWQVFLPSDSGWQEAVFSAPEDLLAKGEKEMWVAMNQGSPEELTTQSGYLLPWHGGQTANLSRSVGHDADFSTAHFSFDFYVPGNTVCPSGEQAAMGTEGANFNIYASRAGTVWGWKDSVENCDHSSVNFIVLRNADDPTIFQLYMHLSQNSIPAELKTIGTHVARGQFIAQADNTGNSTGSHLHFQIERQPYWPADNPYWATALDMTFDDVDINGGRPRVSPLDPPYCKDSDICDVFRQTYMSNNYYMGDSTPPVGELSGVSHLETVRTNILTLSGWGYDNQTGLDYGQLKGFFGGAWHNLGPQFNPTITYSWNLCDPAMEVEDGFVSVALLLYDIAGNPAPLVGLRTFIKEYACPSPPPACIPDQNQVTLFEDPFYQGGCVKFNFGDYPTGNSLSPLGNNDAEAILVGSNAIASLYSEENYSGHSQSVAMDTAFLKYQWADSNTVSSMKVSMRNQLPQAPRLVNPTAAATFREGDIIPLAWIDGGGATEYQIEIYKNGSWHKTIPWQPEPVSYVDSLLEGAYSWRVQGRNTTGAGGWSQNSTFTIVSAIISPIEKTLPYSDTMDVESDWARDGLWSYKANSAMAHSGSHSWWYQNSYGNYDTGQPNWGSLTSPPISISSAGYYLRFYYRYQTETQGKNWDQRWIQISVDGEPFTNLVQIYDDPQMDETSSWLRSKAIDLSGYVGHNIRLRFQFSTLDATANNFPGWGIDDLSITSTPPQNCGDSRQDETPGQAFLITYDPSIVVPGEICPNGDYDYFYFYGTAGDRIVADIDAKSIGSPLDAYIFLLDSDGEIVLAENDDEIYSQLRDPLLSYRLPKNDVYYIKLRAWKHPLNGGEDNYYTMRLYEDRNKPIASISWPTSNSYLPDRVMTVLANISDVNNGVNRVDFYWHSTDWQSSEWVLLGTDRNGADGWSISFDPAGQPEGYSAAFFIKAYDMAGNYASAGAWNLGVDKTAPTTEMLPLATTQTSSAFLVQWTSSDNLSGIDYVEIQEKMNDTSWTTYPAIDGLFSNHWMVGTPGNVYSYRMHGIDHSGNSEYYPTAAEATTAIPEAAVICFNPDSYDTSGNDNSPANASLIYTDGASQIHNYCNPLAADYQNDVDWVKLMVTEGEHYLIQSLADNPVTASVISLYAQDGTTLLAEAIPWNYGVNSALGWAADRSETVYIRFRHLDGRVIGSDVTTTISVKTGLWTFMPVVQR